MSAQSSLHKKSVYIFTLYRTSVIILTPPALHTEFHSIVQLCMKGVLQTNREAFFEKDVFRFFLKEWRDGELQIF